MAMIKQESEDIKIAEVFSVKHQETVKQTGAKPGTGQVHRGKGQTLKDCYTCRRKIGIASKTCQHCSAKQPYKQKLEKKKKQISQAWIDRQKKNCSVNKVYDATNLLLHKWELLERFPVLLLARRTSSGFSAECFCPWKRETEETQEAFLTIKRLYESLLKDEGARILENSTQTETSSSSSESSESRTLFAASSSLTPSSSSLTPPSSSLAPPSSSLTPPSSSLTPPSSSLTPPSSSLTPPSSSLTPPSSSLTPPSSSLAPPSSSLTPPSSSLTPPSSSLTPPSSSLAPPSSSLAPPLSASVKRSTEGPVSSSREKRPIKRKADPKECPMHKDSAGFPYINILRRRIRKGHDS